jgi:phage N-6-adenine-methyltransferase
VSGRNSNTASARKAKDDWRTPKWLWEILNAQYQFGVDCAATVGNTLCEEFIVEGQTMMPYAEDKTVWVNPPFSNPWMMQNYWVKRLKKVGIYRCDNLESRVWQQVILPNVDWVFIFSHRVNYEGHDGKGSMFGSALFGAGVLPPQGLKGTLLRLRS